MSASFTPPPGAAKPAQNAAASPITPNANIDPAARTEQASLRRHAYARTASRTSAQVASRHYADRSV
ncbi:MAG: hypothetical protein EPO23_00010 [Xanthobacteraceae bacterium]|nr:MAG: hypothetical protein EPO23_00010 [Xanthobacteraceae bacterium]